MELELALKITRTRDDINSLTDLRISKDPHGPLFVSKETKTMFVLIAHLKDYREDNIDIKINEDGSRIEIAGAKPVEEMVLKRWIMWNKKLKLRTFKKVFRVPDGVILDKIKAKFNDEDSALTITMPKMVKEIVGVVIEEVKEEEVDKGTQETGNNIDTEPETTSEQESKEAEQVVETTKPEIAQTTAGESPMEESDRGGTSATEDGLIEQESKKMEEILNIDPEPETTSVQESKEDEQVVETKPEIAQTTAGEAPMEESDRGGTSATEDGLIEEESKEIGEVSDNKGESDAMENIPQEVPEKVEPSASKAVEEPQSEEIPELKEDTPEAEKEVVRSELLVTGVEEPIKPEPDQEQQAENKEQVHEQEIDQARNEIQESVDKVESNAKENAPERVGQMVEEASQGIEDQMEVKESTLEKVEPPSASIALEPMEVLPKREAQEQKTTMPPPVEQQQPQEIPELEEETAEAEKGVEGPELSVTEVEESKTNEKREIKSKDVKELEKQEAGVGVEEPIKPEPDQEEQAANEIQESVDKVEPDATKNVPERVRQIVQQTLQEIEDQMQVKESTPEKVEEPSASNALEPKEVQPERETLEPETTMPSPIEEPQPKEIPELKEETSEAEEEVEPPSASIALEPKEVLPKREAQEHKTTMPPPVEQQQPQEIPELEEETAEAEKEAEGPELSVTGVEERKTNEKREIKSKVVKEIEKQEAGVGVEEPIKPEPEKVEESSASNALEPKEVQPEGETLEPETTMPSPVEEPQPKEIPELKEETSEAQKEVVGSELSETGVEEHLTNEKSQIKSNLVEELKRQEAGVNVEEPINPEPDQEELKELAR